MLLYIQNINNRKISVFTELKSNQNEDYFNYGYILTEDLNNIDLQVGDIISGIKLSEQKIQDQKNKYKIKITNKLRKLNKTERKQLISENKYEYVLFHLGKNKLFSSERKANNKRKRQLLYEAKRCFDICEQDFPFLNYIYFYRSIICFNLKNYSAAYADLTNKKYPTVKKEENNYFKFLGISAFHHKKYDESILYLNKYNAKRDQCIDDGLRAESEKYILLGKSHYHLNKEKSEYYVKKNFEQSIKYSLELYNRHDNTDWRIEREAQWGDEALDEFTFNLRKDTYGWVADNYYDAENYEKALEYYTVYMSSKDEINKDNNIMNIQGVKARNSQTFRMKKCYFKTSNYSQMLEIILNQIESFSFDAMDEEDGYGFCGKHDYVDYRNDNIVQLWYQAAFCEYKARNYIKSFYYLKIAISICVNKEWEIGEKYEIFYSENLYNYEGHYILTKGETHEYVGSLKETIQDFYYSSLHLQHNYFSEEEYKEMTPKERGGIIQAKQLDRLLKQLFWWQNRIEKKVGHKITNKEMANVIYIDFEEMYDWFKIRQRNFGQDSRKKKNISKLKKLLNDIIKLDGLHYQAYYYKAKLIYQYDFDSPDYDWYEEDSEYPFDYNREIAFECISKCLTIKPDFIEGYELRINIRKKTEELKGNTIDRKILSMLKKLKIDKERKKSG